VAVPILCYHNVAPPPRTTRFPNLYIDPKRLESQFQWLRRLGLRGVALREALPSIAAGARSKLVALTFDDGYQDVFEHAVPLLRKYGFTATCFAVSDTLGDHNRWDADFVGARKPVMTRDDLRRWIDAGFEVGSHSHTHARLPTLPPELASEEIASSRAILGAELGVAIENFSYPYGAVDARARDLVFAAGYRSACGTAPHAADSTDDVFCLPRFIVDGTHGTLRFLHKVASSFR
jgi:peptidoglycan/xylan/chitin deacetylase (PgdA/CDA1 family)